MACNASIESGSLDLGSRYCVARRRFSAH